MNLDEYIYMMGVDCRCVKGGGIDAKTVYRNVYATCSWLDINMLGVSHVSSFYTQALHIFMFLWLDTKDFACAFNYLTRFVTLRIGKQLGTNQHFLCLFSLHEFVEVGCMWMDIMIFIMIE